jgi:outer membrane protein TolC
MQVRPAIAVLVALALAGCALKTLPPREESVRQAMPNAAPPPQWAAPGGAASAVADNWLASFNDPRLAELVKEALVYNADLRIAAARVDTAAAYLAGAKSPLWPQVNLLARGGGKMGGDSSGLQGVGLFASWELDLWGRVRSAVRSTELQYESAQLDASRSPRWSPRAGSSRSKRVCRLRRRKPR